MMGSSPASVHFFSKYLQYEMFVESFYVHSPSISARGSIKEMKWLLILM